MEPQGRDPRHLGAAIGYRIEDLPFRGGLRPWAQKVEKPGRVSNADAWRAFDLGSCGALHRVVARWRSLSIANGSKGIGQKTKAQRVTEEVAKLVHAGSSAKVETVDFNDPKRSKTCLEVDFPILAVNQVAVIEGS